MKKSRKIGKVKQAGFEDSLKRVEDIVRALEDDNLPLQRRVDKFEEGIRLLRCCEDELKAIEFSIQKVVDENGRVGLEEVE